MERPTPTSHVWWPAGQSGMCLRSHRSTPRSQSYLNRLSDHLFVLARVLNGQGARDVLWAPGANRERA